MDKENEPKFEDLFGKLLTAAFKGITEFGNSLNAETEPDTTDTNDKACPEVEIDIDETEYKEPTLKDIFNKENIASLEETVKDISGKVKDFLSDFDKLAKAKEFFLEQLETTSKPEAKKNTIEKFGLDENTKFDVYAVITL